MTAPPRAVDHVPRWQRVRGALLLSAAADGLGAPLEGQAAVSPGDLDEWMHHSTGTLYWTDDTAQTLVLADHLARRRGIVEQDALATELAAEWRARPDLGYGAGTARLLGTIAAGGDWRRAGSALFSGEGSYGDGAAMRVAPIGLLPGLALSAVAARAARSAEISHRHPVALDGAVAQAGAVHLALTLPRSAPIDPCAFVDRLRPHLHTEEFTSTRGERDLPLTWGLRLHAASRLWTKAHALARLARNTVPAMRS